MELIFYIILLCLSSVIILSENNTLYRYIFIPFLIIFLFVVRNEGFDTDIKIYANQMHATGMDLYYLREFVFWIGSRFIYYIFQDEFYSFLFMDLIWILIMVRTGNRMFSNSTKNINNALLLVIVTSFPFVFGYENIYRQFYATVFALYSYSLIEKKYYSSIFVFLIAFFMHNIVVILLPLFLVKRFYKFKLSDRIQISIIVSFLFIASLSLLTKLKSTEKTGLDMGFFYFLIFLVLLILGMLIYRKTILMFFEKIPSLFFVTILMSGLVTLEVDMISERIGMMFICFLIYDLFRYTSEIKNKALRSLIRLSILLIFSLPTLIFENSYKFLV